MALSSGLMNKLYHINDMTYNTDTGEIIIACSWAGHRQEVYTIDAAKLQRSAAASEFEHHYISCRVAAIDYNSVHSRYIVGISGKLNYFAILDNDFNIIETIGYTANQDTDNKWERQGICADEQYIYYLCFYCPKTNQTDIELEIRFEFLIGTGIL